jgi:hypothetical protein
MIFRGLRTTSSSMRAVATSPLPRETATTAATRAPGYSEPSTMGRAATGTRARTASEPARTTLAHRGADAGANAWDRHLCFG